MSQQFSQLVKILDQLRGEEGCPWDREQTRESLKPFLVEEAYEVLEAIEEGKPIKLKEELGDLLLQVVLHCQIGKEQREFDVEEVLSACIEKLIRRHPHVFSGKKEVMTAQKVLEQWEDLKRRERGSSAVSEGETSLLEGLPKALPALLQAHRVQERVARVGFDFGLVEGEGVQEVLAKIREELTELEEAIQQKRIDQIEQELGDLLFSQVNLSRLLRMDPEGVLRATTYRFIARFKQMNRLAEKQGRALKQLTLDELNGLWERAKQDEKSGEKPS
jgi:tetrapyrrole methylase family protein/MazG family protein